MRKNTHIVGGILFGFMGLLILESFKRGALPHIGWSLESILHMSFISIFLMAAMSIFGAILPDIIDPPFTAKHRLFAHSKALLFILLVLWAISFISLLDRSSLGVLAIYYFLLGYISHLALDSLTPSGLW